MSIGPAEFRRVMARLASAVTVVTAADPGGAPRGLTASAVASVSLDPPLVLACVDRQSDTHDCIERAGAFAVNVLSAADAAVADRFANHPGSEKFEGIPFRTDVTGAPLLDGALAWVDCRLWASYDGGDHTIFVGRVVAGDTGAGAPLLHFCGGYVRLDR